MRTPSSSPLPQSPSPNPPKFSASLHRLNAASSPSPSPLPCRHAWAGIEGLQGEEREEDGERRATAVKYGDKIKLFARSDYLEERSQVGGYVG